jgi:hypothetical protein
MIRKGGMKRRRRKKKSAVAGNAFYTRKGLLRIKNLSFGDAGVYTCKGDLESLGD